MASTNLYSLGSTTAAGSAVMYLTCRLSQWGFSYGSTSDWTYRLCTSTSPSFPGEPPWIISVTPGSDMHIGGPSNTFSYSTAVFNPRDNSLVAQPIFMSYVVEDGTTCAPNCQSPYTGGTYSSPLPTATESYHRDKSWDSLVGLFIAFPIVIFGLFFVCSLCAFAPEIQDPQNQVCCGGRQWNEPRQREREGSLVHRKIHPVEGGDVGRASVFSVFVA
ncbi:hypothetical protein BCR34DRAFT_594779 [Clohesyomyces aquaticus]|uniref:Uncharacterized protein n=1 Tax=Clohesyomyces aquaticus TaxID=1231657 RepID=A0A1Y1Y4P0_9PLEO|nr:hypothetical protein BCR34DRAFT_594779 [Clohesyomyces aquaticus]